MDKDSCANQSGALDPQERCQDCGHARGLHEADEELSRDHAYIGSPAYLGPEDTVKHVWTGRERDMPNFPRAPEGSHYRSFIRGDGLLDVFLVSEA